MTRKGRKGQKFKCGFLKEPHLFLFPESKGSQDGKLAIINELNRIKRFYYLPLFKEKLY